MIYDEKSTAWDIHLLVDHSKKNSLSTNFLTKPLDKLVNEVQNLIENLFCCLPVGLGILLLMESIHLFRYVSLSMELQ